MTLSPVVTRTAYHIARFGPCGHSPYGPGTVGSAAALALFWLVGPLHFLTNVAIAVLIFVIGWWACQVEERTSGQHDCGAWVIDEVAGIWLIALCVPFTFPWLIIAFFVFRILDIAKPFPIKWLDRNVPGGLGVMVDDAVAGLVGGLALRLLYHFF